MNCNCGGGCDSCNRNTMSRNGRMNARNNYSNGGLTQGRSHAQGGMPGVIRSTGEPIEFQGGEYIHRNSAVEYYGVDFMNKVNSMQFKKGEVFKNGGLVNNRRNQMRRSFRNGGGVSPSRSRRGGVSPSRKSSTKTRKFGTGGPTGGSRVGRPNYAAPSRNRTRKFGTGGSTSRSTSPFSKTGLPSVLKPQGGPAGRNINKFREPYLRQAKNNGVTDRDINNTSHNVRRNQTTYSRTQTLINGKLYPF